MVPAGGEGRRGGFLHAIGHGGIFRGAPHSGGHGLFLPFGLHHDSVRDGHGGGPGHGTADRHGFTDPFFRILRRGAQADIMVPAGGEGRRGGFLHAIGHGDG